MPHPGHARALAPVVRAPERKASSAIALAGLVLEARCTDSAGSLRPSTIVVDGEPTDPARIR